MFRNFKCGSTVSVSKDVEMVGNVIDTSRPTFRIKQDSESFKDLTDLKNIANSEARNNIESGLSQEEYLFRKNYNN